MNKLRRTIFLLCLFCAVISIFAIKGLAAQDLEQGIKGLSNQLSESMTGQVKKLAVVEFSDLNGRQSALGQFIAEELITQLSVGPKPGQFDIVERRQLARVLREQELADSSLFDAASIAKIGKILGIEAIVTGSIADLGSDVKINARAISVETAKVFAAASVKIPKTETVQQLMRQTAEPMQGGGVGRSLPSSKGSPVQHESSSFKNEFLSVEVTSVDVSKDKERLSLSLSVQNVSAQDIFLALNQNGSFCGAQVADNLGAVVPVTTWSSHNLLVTGLPCLSDDGLKGDRQNYLRILPGGKAAAVLVFKGGIDKFSGNVFTLSARIVKFNDEAWSTFLINLSNIELEK